MPTSESSRMAGSLVSLIALHRFGSEKGTGTPARRGSADYAKMSRSPVGFSTEPLRSGFASQIANSFHIRRFPRSSS